MKHRLSEEPRASKRPRPLRLFSCLLLVLLTGCSRAPSVDIWGSFFPVWMICLMIGVGLSFVLRLVLLRWRLESEVGPLALFYPCSVMLFTSLLWFIFFR